MTDNLKAGFAMGTAHSRPRQHERDLNHPPRQDANGKIDVNALIEENAQLRELVIQLSKLVIKNVVDKK